jgi:hypothetical protein
VIGVFKQKSPGNIVLLLLLGLVLKIPLFLYPRNIAATDKDGQLYHAFVSLISSGGKNAFAASVIAFVLLYVQALMLNYLVDAYRLANKQTYLPGMAYLLITSLLPEWSFLSSALVASTLVIGAFILLFRLYNLQTAKSTIYNLGLLAGISSYIFFPSVFFGVCILLGILILKPFRVNEMALFVLGCVTPYYFFAAYLYLTDQFTLQAFLPSVYFSAPDIENSIWLATSTLLLTIPFLLGGYFVQVNLRKMLIQARKNWSIALFYLVLGIFLPYVNNAETFHAWVLVLAPFAVFHASAYFYPNRILLPLTIFLLTISFIFYQQYGTANWH